MNLSFSRSLYTNEAVEAAAQAYAGVAKIEVHAEGSDVLATIEPLDADAPPDLADAFANHVLFETIVRHRGTGAA
jgi:hypothetical protein